ncbi:MAG TPA: hypothetical protein VH253_17660 [Phycisphaerae bacterium]|nr:hypothetical protein [Phycisphaerae bacterium]
MTTKPFALLRAKMTDAASSATAAAGRKQLAEMLLGEIRKATNLPAASLGAALGIDDLTPRQNQPDMRLSVLREIVEALGGSMELVLHFPHGDIQATPAARAHPTRNGSKVRPPPARGSHKKTARQHS